MGGALAAVLLRLAEHAVIALTAAPARGPQLEPVALVDLLDRLLGAGMVVSGDLVISLAGVDLVQIRLHALIASVRAEMVPR